VTSVPALPLPPPVADLVPQDLLDRIIEFAFAGQPGSNGPAPPCRNQGPYNFGGEITQYPHVGER
jgi:phospholipid/cholesterol/gamma-HCH transport system substrate-binding protein